MRQSHSSFYLLILRSTDIQASEYFCRHPCHFANSMKVVCEDLHCRITVIVARPSADVSATLRCARDCRTILWLSIRSIFKTRIRSMRPWTPEYLGYLCMALVGLLALEWTGVLVNLPIKSELT